MKKIKIALVATILCVIALVLHYKYISAVDAANFRLLKTINEEKSYVQNISKQIFYLYKNRQRDLSSIEEHKARFLANLKHKEEILGSIDSKEIHAQAEKIIAEWKRFLGYINRFEKLIVLDNSYAKLTLPKLINEIYKSGMKIEREFDRIIDIHKRHFDTFKEVHKTIQTLLYIILFGLLIYLTTQIKDVISFVQAFLKTSNKIRKNASIKEIEPISYDGGLEDVSLATKDFNAVVANIYDSIEYSAKTIEQSVESFRQIESHIEVLLHLIETVEERNDIDKELIKKESVFIEALEELENARQKLELLKENMKKIKNND